MIRWCSNITRRRKPAWRGGSCDSTSTRKWAERALHSRRKAYCGQGAICSDTVSTVAERMPRGNTVREGASMVSSVHSRRRVLALGAAGVASLSAPSIARAQTQVVRIGVPTKTYYPTIIAETAIRQKLFEKEGIKAELTIYRSGAEGFEAIAAGAADLILNSSSSVAAGLKKGVNVRCVANGSNGYYGWYLVVKTDSPLQKVSELA